MQASTRACKFYTTVRGAEQVRTRKRGMGRWSKYDDENDRTQEFKDNPWVTSMLTRSTRG